MILSDSGNEFAARECQVDFLDANWKVLDSDNDELVPLKKRSSD